MEAVPVEQVLDGLLRWLQISLDAEQRQRAITEWREYAVVRPDLSHLDRNRNWRVSDGIAVCFLNSLQRNGFYHPSDTGHPATDRLGSEVVHLGGNTPSKPSTADVIVLAITHRKPCRP